MKDVSTNTKPNIVPEETLEMISLDDETIARYNSENTDKQFETNDEVNIKPLKKKKRKAAKSVFKKGLLIYITVLSLVIVTLLILLWSKLDNYQKSYDKDQAEAEYKKNLKHAPQEFFKDYMNNITSNDWIQIWKNGQDYVLDTEETVRSFIDDNITNINYSLYKSPNYTSEVPSYVVGYNDTILATFKLAGQDDNWHIDEAKVTLSGNKAAIIEVPDYCIVSCNGITLDNAFITSSVSYNKVPGYEDALVNAPIYVTYEISGLINEPELSVSATTPIAVDSKSRYYKLSDEANNSTYKQQAESFIRSLLHYYSMGKTSVSENMAAAASHVASGSEASKVIHSSLDGLKWVSATNANYILEGSEVYRLADNCIFVDISYYNSNAVNEDDKNDIQTYRVFFLDFGSGYKIYSFSNI